jgi:hypothetical protein
MIASGVPVDLPLDESVLARLPLSLSLPATPPTGHCRWPKLGSRCPSCTRSDPDSHNTDNGRWVIDAERRGLGRSIVEEWTEADWVRRVPIHVRGAHMPYVTDSGRADTRRRSSRQRVHHQLTVEPPTTWLDYAVFRVASFEYDIGIFVIYSGGSSEWFCERIRANADRHILLYRARRHYECVEYDGQRLFLSDHAFVAAMSQFAAQHPAHPHEDDPELRAVEAQEEASVDATATVTVTEVAEPPVADTPLKPRLLVMRKAASARL